MWYDLTSQLMKGGGVFAFILLVWDICKQANTRKIKIKSLLHGSKKM